MNKPYILDNPLEALFTPEQIQFLKILETQDIEEAIRQTGVSTATLYQWQRQEGFQLYLRELGDQAAENVYHQVLKQAQALLTRCKNLSEHMSIPEQTQALKAIVKLVAASPTKRSSPATRSSRWTLKMKATTKARS